METITPAAQTTSLAPHAAASAHLAQRILEYQRRADERVGREIDAAVHAVRIEEATRIRAEERARYDDALEAARLQFEQRCAEASNRTRLELEQGSDALARARELASQTTAELRARLDGQLEEAAQRERAAKESADLAQRGHALERSRWEEAERSLRSQLLDAQEASRLAEGRAKLALERWKTEAELSLHGREAVIAREEVRLKEEKASLADEREAAGEAAIRYPALKARAQALETDADDLRRRLSEAQAKAVTAAAEAEAAQSKAQREASQRAHAEASLAAAETARDSLSRQLEEAKQGQRSAKLEAFATFQLLEGQLADVTVKLRETEGKLTRQGSEHNASLAAAAAAKLQEIDAINRKTSEQASALRYKLQQAHHLLTSEHDRAAQLEAELAGSQHKAEELARTVADLRASNTKLLARRISGVRASPAAPLPFPLLAGSRHEQAVASQYLASPHQSVSEVAFTLPAAQTADPSAQDYLHQRQQQVGVSSKEDVGPHYLQRETTGQQAQSPARQTLAPVPSSSASVSIAVGSATTTARWSPTRLAAARCETADASGGSVVPASVMNTVQEVEQQIQQHQGSVLTKAGWRDAEHPWLPAGHVTTSNKYDAPLAKKGAEVDNAAVAPPPPPPQQPARLSFPSPTPEVLAATASTSPPPASPSYSEEDFDAYDGGIDNEKAHGSGPTAWGEAENIVEAVAGDRQTEDEQQLMAPLPAVYALNTNTTVNSMDDDDDHRYSQKPWKGVQLHHAPSSDASLPSRSESIAAPPSQADLPLHHRTGSEALAAAAGEHAHADELEGIDNEWF